MAEDNLPARAAPPDLDRLDTAKADADEPGQRGSLIIANKVVERMAVIAAREMDEVTATGTRWSSLPLMSSGMPTATAKVAGGRARIRVDVAAQWPLSATEVAQRVRDHVRDQVSTLAGINVDAVDVTVADIVRASTQRRVT